jgi:hypothetical protein
VTQPEVRVVYFEMDEETEREFLEVATEDSYAYYLEYSQWLDDYMDGFHKKSPRERMKLYQAAEPVFDPTIPEEMLEVFLEAGAYEPLVDVYDVEGLIRPPTPGPEIVDAAGVVTLGQPMPALLGQAPELLGPYWQRLWAVDREEALKCLKDYRDILKRKLAE